MIRIRVSACYALLFLATALSLLSPRPLSAQVFQQWPPAYINISPIDLTHAIAVSNGHTYNIEAQGASDTASLSAGPAAIAVVVSTGYFLVPSTTPRPSASVNGYSIDPWLVNVSALIPLDTTPGVPTVGHNSLERSLCIDNSAYAGAYDTAGNPGDVEITLQGMPFMRYKVTTSDPAVMNSIVTIRIKHGGYVYAKANPSMPNALATATSTIWDYSVSKTVTLPWLGGQNWGPGDPFVPYCIVDTFTQCAITNGVGYFWTNMTPTSHTRMMRAGRAWSQLQELVMPIGLSGP